jgi:hypothetical protein
MHFQQAAQICMRNLLVTQHPMLAIAAVTLHNADDVSDKQLL